MPAKVQLKNIHKSFGDAEIIKGVSFEIEPSEFVVLVGPSGCGKSTLLRTIAGLETITSGDLCFDADIVNDWSPAKRRVGMVFQSYALYPHMSVAENIGFGLKLAKKEKSEREARVNEALKVLQLEALRDHKPSQLSGGQRQRVAIGRAIVRNPNVFLFDEPLSNLDTALRVQMRMEIGRLHRRLKNTVVYVTHDQVEAMTLADRIVVLEAGEVRQIGRPLELYAEPANKFVAGFIGTPKMGFFAGKISGTSSDATTISLSADRGGCTIVVPFAVETTESGQDVTLGIRAEHCQLTSIDRAILTGEVLELERLGSDTFAFLDILCAEEPVAVRMPPDTSALSGERVGLTFDLSQCHLFDAEGEALSADKRPSSIRPQPSSAQAEVK